MADRMVVAKSDKLVGKRVAVAICGGIAAVEIVKIIREIRRHGAEVTAFMSPSSRLFITPLSVEWASGRPVVLEAGPEVEYLDGFDLVLVAPATLNCLAKTALAITDSAVMLLIATQIGRMANHGALVFVPTMNIEMTHHPLYSDYLERLEKWGAKVFESPMEEERLKMPTPENLAEFLLKVMKCG